MLLPGLLLSQKMQMPLARQLAARGNRVITLDPLGHGQSDRPLRDLALLDVLLRPADASRCSTTSSSTRAIVGGTSLGANITLEVASLAPERLRGMVIEMPVLDSAIAACGAAFTPLLFALKFGEPAMRRWPAAPAPCRAGACPSCSESGLTGSPRIPRPAPPCSAGSSTAAWPPTTASARPSRRPRW